jgi:peptide/nickel transport system substrate-binding protein
VCCASTRVPTTTAPCSGAPRSSRTSPVIAPPPSTAATVGIDLVSRPLDRSATVDAIFTQRDFDIGLISYCNGTDPDIGVKRMYVSSNIGPIPFSNAAAYRDQRVDELFDAAGKTSLREDRRAAYREIEEILGRDLPYWWLVETTFVSGYKESLEGFRPWTGQFAEHARYKP